MAQFADRPERLTALTTYLISQTARIAKRDLDARLAERGLRLRHMAALAVLVEGATTQLDLSRRLDLDPSDVTGTVDDLEDAGFARRSPDPADRRRKVVTVTAAGRRQLAQLERTAQQTMDVLLEPIPATRRRQLHEDLRRVLLAQDARATA